MFEITQATYNITDNRLKFWPAERLSDDDYKKVKALSFQWWPGRKCFSAIWAPGAEDLIITNGGTIEADDSPDDIEGRVERFQQYAARDEADAESAAQRAIEATTRRRAEAAESTAAKKADEAQYWQRRIAGAISRAEYRDRVDVIARRIKGIEADVRKREKERKNHAVFLANWQKVKTREVALYVANYDHVYVNIPPADDPKEYRPKDSSTWRAIDSNWLPWEQAQDASIKAHEAGVAWAERWINHLNMRLEYERAYLEAVGGAPQDKLSNLKPGDSVLCRGEVCTVIKVNKETVKIDRPSFYWLKNGMNVPKTDLKPVEA